MVGYSSSSDPIATTYSLVIIAAATLIITIVVARRTRSPSLFAAVLLAVTLDTFLGITLGSFYGSLRNDSATWHWLASNAADYLAGRSHEKVSYVEGKEGYVWILGGLYAVSGSSPLVAVAFGVSCHAFLILTTSATAKLLVGVTRLSSNTAENVVRTSAYLTAMLPVFIWWAPQVLRESLSILLVSLSVCLIVSSLARRRMYPVVIAVVVLAVLWWVRSSLGMMVAIALLASVIYILLRRSKYHFILRLTLIAVTVASIPVLQAEFNNSINATGKSIAVSTAELSEIASSGFGGLTAGSSLGNIFMITAPRVLFGPFVWEFSSSPVMLLAFTELACWIFIVVTSMRGANFLCKDTSLQKAYWLLPAFFVVVLFILVGLTFTVGNYGILSRLRPIATTVLIPLSSIGLVHMRAAHEKAPPPKVDQREGRKN